MSEKKLQIQKLKIKERQTLRSLLKEIKIEGKYYAIIINGKAVTDLATMIDPEDKILILPKIIGG